MLKNGNGNESGRGGAKSGKMVGGRGGGIESCRGSNRGNGKGCNRKW